MPKRLIYILSALIMIRVLFGLLFPLTADESYYWLWSKHLALSYVDHPPMIAYLNFLLTFGRESLLFLRLGTALIATLVSLLIYFLAKEIFGQKVAFWSAILFQLIPHFLIIWLTMFVELLLVLFWALSLLILSQIIKNKNANLWYLLSIPLGLGYLSKYTMFLFLPSLFLFCLMTPGQRFWFKKKEPYLGIILSLLFFIPVLQWNLQNNFLSFAFHLTKTTADPFGSKFLEFIADQLIHFTPFLLFLLYGTYKFALKRNDQTRLLFYFSAFPLLLFTIAATKIKVWAHWPSMGYISFLPLAIAYLNQSQKSIKKFMAAVLGFSILILAVLFFIFPGVLLNQGDYRKNFKLADQIPKEYKIFARTNVSASLLEFYGKRTTFLATGFMRPGSLWGEQQYKIWGIPNLKKGETILYYGKDNQKTRNKALKYFKKVTETGYRLQLIENYINQYKIFKFEDYFGEENTHP